MGQSRIIIGLYIGLLRGCTMLIKNILWSGNKLKVFVRYLTALTDNW